MMAVPSKARTASFEHVLGGHVEVVGGLVEDEQVDGLQQQADHRQARPLAAGEHADELLRGLAAKHKGTEQVVDLQAHLSPRHLVDGLEDRQPLVEELGLILGEIADLHVVASS